MINTQRIKKISKYLSYYIHELFSIQRIIKETKNTQSPITFGIWFMQRVLGFNRKAYWPMHFTSMVGNPENVYVGIDSAPGYSPGCYIQGTGKTIIGDYTQIASNVGIISANHNLVDSRKHIMGEVHIGKYCWIGMNSMILPDVILGDFTIVGAGSVVTKSFPDGYCVVAGNPAKIIKKLDRFECRPFVNEHEYNGYVKSRYFSDYQKKFHIMDGNNDNNS